MGDDPERRAIGCSRYCICARRPWRKVPHEGHGRVCHLRCDLLPHWRHSAESKDLTGRSRTNPRLNSCESWETGFWEVAERMVGNPEIAITREPSLLPLGPGDELVESI